MQSDWFMRKDTDTLELHREAVICFDISRNTFIGDTVGPGEAGFL